MVWKFGNYVDITNNKIKFFGWFAVVPMFYNFLSVSEENYILVEITIATFVMTGI